LPVAFGTIADDEERLREVLHRNHDVLLGQLRRLRGKIEMGLNVYWERRTFSSFSSKRIGNSRRCAIGCSNPAERPRSRKSRDGQTFRDAASSNAEMPRAASHATLSPHCVEIRSIDPGEEKMVMNWRV